jgi:enterobacterial common antigen flippase
LQLRAPAGRTGVAGALFSIAAVQVLTILVGIGRSKGVALVLGPAGLGVVSAIDQAVATTATFGAFALPYTAMKFMARSHSDGDAAFRRTGAGFLRLLIALSLVTAPLAYALFTIVPDLLGNDLAPYNPVIRIAMVSVPPAMLLVLFVNAFAAAKRPVTGASINLIFLGAAAGAAVIGAYARGLQGLYVTNAIVSVIVMVGGLVYLRRSLGISLTEAHTGIIQTLRSDPAVIGYSACFYITLLAYMVMLLAARTIAFDTVGAEGVGHLQAMMSIALAFGAVLTALTNLYLAPLVNRRGDALGKTAEATKFATRILILLLLGALPALLFPGVFLSLLFRADFAIVADLLWWFILWQSISQIGNILQQLLIGLDDVLYIAIAATLAFGTTIAGMAWLTPDKGIAGTGVALCAGAILHFSLLAARLRIRHGARIPAGLLVRLVGLVAIIGASHALFAGTVELTAEAIAYRIAFSVAALLLGWLTLDPHERDPRALFAALRGGTARTTSP